MYCGPIVYTLSTCYNFYIPYKNNSLCILCDTLTSTLCCVQDFMYFEENKNKQH